MKVSVIIPLYNQGAFVKTAVDSALAQAETGEVIVVDDGSTDGSGEIEEYTRTHGSGRLRYLRHPDGKRHGVSASRNSAIEAARHPFIAFLDADDYMLPDRFRKTAELFAQFPETDAIAEALGFEGDERHVTMMRSQVPPSRIFFEMEPFGKNGHFSVCALTVRKSVIATAGNFDESLRAGEDTEWCARLALTSRIRLGDLERPVAIRRVHERNTSKNAALTTAQKPEMALKLIRWAADRGYSPETHAILLKVFLKYHYEANRIFGKKSRIAKKISDLNACRRLLRVDPSTRHLPLFRYFFRTIFHLPVRRHMDYYG